VPLAACLLLLGATLAGTAARSVLA